MKVPLLITCLLVICAAASAQPAGEPATAVDSLHTIEVSLSAGPSFTTFRDQRSPISPYGLILGGSTMLRVMWHPARLIAFGLSTGYTFFSRENFSYLLKYLNDTVVPGRATIHGIPVQFAVSMQKAGFEAGVAMGPYIMSVDLFDADHTRASRMELGITVFASYDWSLGWGLRGGPGLRFIMLAHRGVYSVVPEYRIRYDLLAY